MFFTTSAGCQPSMRFLPGKSYTGMSSSTISCRLYAMRPVSTEGSPVMSAKPASTIVSAGSQISGTGTCAEFMARPPATWGVSAFTAITP